MRSFLISIFIAASFLCSAQDQITAMEYYIDSDPGIGSATPITITPGTTINESFTVSNALLTEGFHTLVIRVQKTIDLDPDPDSTAWGLHESRTFYVSPSDPVTISNVTAGEYYIDSDPGIGSGTSFTIVAGTTIDESFTVPNASLSEGFHNLVIRLQDANGVWGVQENKAIYVSSGDPINTSDVVAAEYYLDSDPGIGAGTAITGFTTGSAITMDFTVPNGILTEGFHVIVIRTQGSDGAWGIQESRAFYVSGSDPIVVNDVIAGEYYIDVDPGIGAANALDFTDADTFDFDFTILSSDLSEGFHNIVLRAQDENGLWGMQESRPVYVSNSNPLGSTEIVEIEVFVDDDPGIGNGAAIDIVDVLNFDETTSIRSDTLSPGMHTVSFRALDALGNWGVMESKHFLVDPYLAAPLDQAGGSVGTIASQLASYEYFVDTDPGYGLGEMVAIDPAMDSIDIDIVVPGDTLTQGAHVLGFRVINDIGLYSQTAMFEFDVCDGADVQFSALLTCLGDTTLFTDESTGVLAGDDYSWDFDNDAVEDSVTVGNSSFVYNSSGVYTVSLTISNANCTSTGTLDVTVADLPTVVANTTDPSICDGDEVTLTGSGADTYSWDNGVTDAIAFAPSNTNTYTVTGTDANGCINTDAVEVVVNPLPTVVANASSNPICLGDELTLTGSGADSYSWDNSVTDGVAFVPTETLTYTVTGTDVNGCINIDMVEVPISSVAPPIITLVSDNGRIITLESSSETGNQWYEDGSLMAGETGNTVTVERTYTFGGQYQVTVEEGDCTSELSDIYDVMILASDELPLGVQLWPNPTSSELVISGLENIGSGKFKIVDLAGSVIIEKEFNLSDSEFTIPVYNFQKGIYLLLIDEHPGYFKFVKK